MKTGTTSGRAKSAALLGAFLLLAGCTATTSPWSPPPGSSPAYTDGYVDGCASGYADAGRAGMRLSGRIDQGRYNSDAQYRAGYRQGFAVCYEDERRTPKMMGNDR